MVGLMKVRKTKGENPEDCVFVRRARTAFKEQELEQVIQLMKEIVNEYESSH
jgi:hypothetical protein